MFESSSFSEEVTTLVFCSMMSQYDSFAGLVAARLSGMEIALCALKEFCRILAEVSYLRISVWSQESCKAVPAPSSEAN